MKTPTVESTRKLRQRSLSTVEKKNPKKKGAEKKKANEQEERPSSAPLDDEGDDDQQLSAFAIRQKEQKTKEGGKNMKKKMMEKKVVVQKVVQKKKKEKSDSTTTTAKHGEESLPPKKRRGRPPKKVVDAAEEHEEEDKEDEANEEQNNSAIDFDAFVLTVNAANGATAALFPKQKTTAPSPAKIRRTASASNTPPPEDVIVLDDDDDDDDIAVDVATPVAPSPVTPIRTHTRSPMHASASVSIPSDAAGSTSRQRSLVNTDLCTEMDATLTAQPLDWRALPLSVSDDSRVNAAHALCWILRPVGEQRFFAEHWEKKALIIHRNADYNTNLFSTEALGEILQQEDIQFGVNLNVALYQNGVRTTHNGKGRAHLRAVRQRIQEGCSVQLTNPQSFSRPLWHLCEVLQEAFCCFVGANTYLTPSNSAGFAPHYDEIDAFIVQLEGRKKWFLFTNAPTGGDDDGKDRHTLPRESSGNFTPAEVARMTAVYSGWLETGDVMYIPRGFVHRAETDAAVHSLHATISVGRQNAAINLLEKLVPDLLTDLARSDVGFRHSLPVNIFDQFSVVNAFTGTQRQTDDRAAFMANMAARMDAVKEEVLEMADAGVDMMAKEFMKTALPPLLTEEERRLSVTGAKETATALLKRERRRDRTQQTRFIRHHGQRLMLESEDCYFVAHRMQNSLVYEGKPEQSIELPTKLVEGFQYLADAYPAWTRIADIRCASDADRMQLIDILFSAGLIMLK